MPQAILNPHAHATEHEGQVMTRTVKVLWISCVGEKGGAEVYMLNLLRHLDRNRFQPSVALLRPGPLKDDLHAMGITVHEFSTHRLRNVPAVWACIGELTLLIRREGYAIVHSNGFRAHVHGGMAAWRAGVPEVWTVHTTERSGLFTRLALGIPTRHVLANCKRTSDWFVARHLPTSLIWPGVDSQKLEQRTPRQTLAARHALPPEGRWICMGARLQRYKGHEHFIRAIASLPASFNNVHGVIIGGTLFGMEQDYPAELRRLAGELGVGRRIHFTGFIPDEDVAGLLHESELLVHPALDEDFGLSVAEAQALGRPVLAFASHGPSAIIKDGETGRLVPVGNQDALGRELAEMLGDPGHLNRWGAAGKVRALECFEARRLAGQLERVYAAL